MLSSRATAGRPKSIEISPVAKQFHNLPGVSIGQLLKAGGKFHATTGVWVFQDGSKGRFISPTATLDHFFQAILDL
jgi:hypothetical protein